MTEFPPPEYHDEPDPPDEDDDRDPDHWCHTCGGDGWGGQR